MPTETRQLVFTNEEVMAAMTSHNRIAAEKLFVGSIVQCRLAADPKVSLHLTIRHETTRNTYDLVFGPEKLVSYLFSMVTLLPGDLILTGTPAGVALARRNAEGRRPWLVPGDVLETEIEGLGRQRNEIV